MAEFLNTNMHRFRKVSAAILKDAVQDASKIEKLAGQKADWIDKCRKCYDGG